MRLLRTVVMCVVACGMSSLGRAAAPTDAAFQSREVERLRLEIAAKEVEIAQLKAALSIHIVREDSVVALSDQRVIRSGSREYTPSSSMTFEQAEQIARLFALMKPGSSFCTVMPTGSMKPFFDEKAVLLMEAAPFEALKVGDIVTYRHPQLGLPVVHRLVIMEGDWFWAKGDANDRMDNVYVTKENYIRRVYGMIYSKEGE